MDKINTNSILKRLQNKGFYQLLSVGTKLMYKVKGKDIKSVNYLNELAIWEFKIGQDYFYSSGPGWAYDYNYLMHEFSTHLGFQYLPKMGDCVVDVGAGVGEELMIFSKLVGSSGKVYAIEAHPKTFKALKYNQEKNAFDNTELLQLAIADSPGHIFIEDTPDSLANKVSQEQHADSFKVGAITIEQLIEKYNIQQVDFMKVNIEGAEQLLIKGIGKTIGKIKNMAISCHDFRYQNEGIQFFKTKKIVLEFLQDSNFECITRTTGNPLLDDYVYAFPRENK